MGRVTRYPKLTLTADIVNVYFKRYNGNTKAFGNLRGKVGRGVGDNNEFIHNLSPENSKKSIIYNKSHLTIIIHFIIHYYTPIVNGFSSFFCPICILLPKKSCRNCWFWQHQGLICLLFCNLYWLLQFVVLKYLYEINKGRHT